jgi:Immunity protein 35
MGANTVISRSYAEHLANEYVVNLSRLSGVELKLMEAETLERGFGWVFYYNSKAYMLTGDPRHIIAGNAPFIVDKHDGSIHETGTAEPVEYYLERYEATRTRS